MTTKIEEYLEAEAKRTNSANTHVKIADIVFSYNNHKLIKLLQERGGNIALQKFDKAQVCDVKIDTLIHTESELKSLTTPRVAFITFEDEDAKNLALKIAKAQPEKVDG